MPDPDQNQELRPGATPAAQQPPGFLPALEVGADFATSAKLAITSILRSLGYTHIRDLQAGLLFSDQKRAHHIIIDLGICRRTDLEYIDYTREQNDLMYRCPRTLRFAVEAPDDTQDLAAEIRHFTVEADTDKPYPRHKRGRAESHPDPSGPEARFEALFSEAFGDSAMHALRREIPFLDFAKSTRYIDYALLTQAGPIAIELNGESFHHPKCIGADRYRSQLYKQNSLVASGWTVFRWSLRGMQDADRFVEEMRRFFGPPETFQKTPHYMANRSVDVFRLMGHQNEALRQITAKRAGGLNTFLIVQPTGTGKTEIFIEDFQRLKAAQPLLNGHVIVPTLTLRDQTQKRLASRLPKLTHSTAYLRHSATSGFMVQTYQHMVRNVQSLSPEAFDYVVVDEAHHAVAAGLRSVLEHLRPQVLMGLTATDERLDQKRLEEVFGSYETNLSLREAIEKRLLPPIRAFRIETNINLSNVRFNGVDYVQADLQRTLMVRSRDEIVADALLKYFGTSGVAKQGVVFCVNIRHAKDMAQLLVQRGLAATAVSGEDRKATATAIEAYLQRKIRFLCSCELLSEGWDAPQTSVLVMARPTMSKVLYVQQLGRGTRAYPGKEALYVLDVVDDHGPLNAPWSVHALFGIKLYEPWANVVGSSDPQQNQEQEVLLNWLSEQERRVTEIDIFTFQEKYEGYLSEEQLARELFVSTGTIKTWLKKGEIHPDVTVPFGAKQLCYFASEQVTQIRKQKNLRVHDETTQYDDFYEFLGERDYTFSYKIIFLLSLLTTGNPRGEGQLDDVAALYSGFYQDRLSQHLPVDRTASPYNRREVLEDPAEIKQSILANPFEKFERKRFMHHCKDLAYIAWHTALWSRLKESHTDRQRIFKQMAEDLLGYYKNLGGLGSTDYLRQTFPEVAPFLPSAPAAELATAENIIFVQFDPEKAFKTCLPCYPLAVAAGNFASSDTGSTLEPEGWVAVAEAGFMKRLTPDMFVSRVAGKSMLPTIPDGALCVFRRGVAGSRQGLVVLVQKVGLTDPETRASFTVKRYHSTKSLTDDGWEHSTIELHPDNKEYPILRFASTNEDQLTILAELVGVLEIPRKTSADNAKPNGDPS
jgi:superfamily II DNA or RNA helicase